MESLAGAAALVTGGSGGLGAAICAALAAEGAAVAVAYRHGKERAETLRDALAAQGRKAIAVQLDQADARSVARAVDEVAKRLGGLDILVNNAAMATGGHALPPGDLEALTPEIWDELMAVNLRGPYLVARAAAVHLRATRRGKIVNIGSTLGLGEWYADRAFAPSKAAVVPLTRYLAAALAPEVAVNCVCPGLMTETDLGSGGPPELAAGWRKRAALGVTTPLDEVAAQVVLLCKASAITGQAIAVDGGIHFH